MEDSEIWAKLASRKFQFRPNDSWETIGMWGYFEKTDVKKLIDSGELMFTGFPKKYEDRHGLQCVKPSKEAYEKYIIPLIEKM
ncbi:MAG: hypothetical protein ABFD07_17900 [Methanobacterium sp.]